MTVKIDTRKSMIAVQVYRAGLFSAFGHDHRIAAPIAGGALDTAVHYVELHINAGSLRVHDSSVSGKDRDQIQKTMLGRDVLDVEHYREIVFRSTGVEPAGTDSWRVRGNLTLHGRIRPVMVGVRKWDGHYMGSARFKQTDFGIKPVRVAGGTIGIKNEVRVEFYIQLARPDISSWGYSPRRKVRPAP